MKWPQLNLEQLAANERASIKIGPFGSQLKKSELVASGIHVLGIENVLNNKFDELGERYITEEKFETLKTVEVKPGDVLITMMGTIGEVAIVPEGISKSIMDSHLLRFRPNFELTNSEYVSWLIRGSSATKAAIHGRAHGAIMKGLNSSIIKSLPAPLPPLSEQQRIVTILDQADALRKKRAEADKKAFRILPTLFYKMFGDPATNPKGWLTKPLGEVTIGNPQYGANASATEWTEGSPRYVRITDITDDGRLLKTGVVTLDLDNWAPYQLTTGDLLFARSGNTVGKTYLYHPQDGLCAYAGYLIRFKADQNQVLPWYLFALTQTGYYKSWVETRKRVAGQPNINGKEYASLQVPCPPIALQEAFVERIERLIDLRDKRNTTEKKIRQLYGVLLHRAFTGQLTAKWREAHMKELLAEMEVQAMALESPPPSKRTPMGEPKKRHAGHDMFNKAALAAYITDRCHAPDSPIGRVKLAKLFYLVQKKAEIELTETFMKRAAGPLDDEIHKFLSLARKNKWVILGRDQGDLKPVKPGANVSKAVKQAEKVMGSAKVKVDEMLGQMKSWGYQALERWATVLDAALELGADGKPVTVDEIKESIQGNPEWMKKLDRDEFSDEKIDAALRGLRGFGFITEQQ
ncbi:MAG: restriction endonuclease subunit S [Deltaproteobacteria bacterium]|nr:restriction endonuclease subunit S [Deltaproteobacteria bacterium]